MLTAEDYRSVTDTHNWHRRFPTWIAGIQNLGAYRYWVPPHAEHLAAVEDADMIRCLSNVCTHRQALILGGAREQSGKLGSRLTCPVHRWNWHLDGRFAGARGFKLDCVHDLEQFPVTSWQGHLWTGPSEWQQDLGILAGIEQYVNIENLVSAAQIDNESPSFHAISLDFDWKVFMEIYLDLYHIAPAHPGLGALADPQNFGYYTGQGWSCQTAGFNRRSTVTPLYRDTLSIYHKTGIWDSARFGSVWLGIYPNTMLEFYPGVVVVSTVWPAGAGRCINYLEFYYDQPLLGNLAPSFSRTFEQYFMQTSDEDRDIGLHIQAGRNSQRGPIKQLYHDPEESAIAHFHQWLADNQLTGSTTR